MEPDGTRKQLYNLDTDHKETKNLVNDEREIEALLTNKLSNWYRRVVQNHHDATR